MVSNLWPLASEVDAWPLWHMGITAMSDLPLLFARDFAYKPKSKWIASCKRDNVVLHVAFDTMANRSVLRRHLAVPAAPFDTGRFNTAKPRSPFSNHHHDIGKHGKVLEYQKRKNIIRSGLCTHADAYRGALFYVRWTRSGRWPTRVVAVNTVVSGELRQDRPANIKHHCRQTSSTKFPGVSLKFPNSSATPIFFAQKYIIPGVTTPRSLETALTNSEGALEWADKDAL